MTRKAKLRVTLIEHDETIKRSRIIKNVEKLIKAVGSILLLFFGWLTLKDFPLISLINDDSASILLKFTLVIYYSSWIFGTSVDLNDEDYTFVIAPNSGKLTKMAITIIFMMGLLFAILCWSESFKVFSISLLVFLLIDFLGNKYLNNFVKKAMEESESKYISSKNYLGYKSLQTIKHFLNGSYVKWRFFVGFIIIFILIIFSYTNISTLFSHFLNVEKQLILSITFFIYVATIEIWIWYKRLMRKIQLSILDEINNEFSLVKKQNNEK